MKRSLRRTVLSAIAVLPALGLFIGYSAAASASVPATAKAASVNKEAEAKAAAVAFVKTLKVGFHSKTHPLVRHDSSQVKALTQVTSTNWSGYADTGSGFSSVSATWKESCPV